MGFICHHGQLRLPSCGGVLRMGAATAASRPSRLGINQTHLPLATGELDVHEAASVCESLLCATLTAWLLALWFGGIWDEVVIGIA